MKVDLIKANMIMVDMFDSSWPSQPYNSTSFHSLDLAGHTLFKGWIPVAEKYLIAEALKSFTLQAQKWRDT